MNNLSKYVGLNYLSGISMYSKAIVIANEVFKEKIDKGGNPYIYHLYDVSNSLDTEIEKTVGLLHDILEDTDISVNDLRSIGFTDEVIDALVLVTHNDTETYAEFIDRIINSNNLTALKVKLRDMENNMDLSRIKNPTKEDYSRIKNKYKKQYNKLIKRIGEYYDRH